MAAMGRWIGAITAVAAGCSGGDGRFETAGGTGASASLAIDDAFLYWADGQMIMRAARGTGPGTPIAPAAGTELEVRVNATTVVWHDVDLFQAPKIGGNVSTVGAVPLGPIQVGIDDAHVYYSRGLTLVDHMLATGTERSLLEDQFTLSVVVDDDELVGTSCQTTGAGDLAIWRMPIAGGPRTPIVRAGCPQAIAADDNFFYAVEQGILRVPKTGGTPVRVLEDASLLFAVRDGEIYAVSAERDRILQVSAAGGTPSVRVEAHVVGVAVDDDTLYWLEQVGDRAVLRAEPR